MGGSGITLIHGKVLIGGGAAVSLVGWRCGAYNPPAGTFTPTRQTRRAHTGFSNPSALSTFTGSVLIVEQEDGRLGILDSEQQAFTQNRHFPRHGGGSK